MSDTDARLRPTPATLAPAVDNAAYFADAIRSIGALYSVAAYLAYSWPKTSGAGWPPARWMRRCRR